MLIAYYLNKKYQSIVFFSIIIIRNECYNHYNTTVYYNVQWLKLNFFFNFVSDNHTLLIHLLLILLYIKIYLNFQSFKIQSKVMNVLI